MYYAKGEKLSLIQLTGAFTWLILSTLHPKLAIERRATSYVLTSMIYL